MSLYLLEIQLDPSTPEKQAQIMEQVEQVVKNNGTPTSQLVAGPWASIENPTLFFVVEIQDLNQTMPEVIALYTAGLIRDTRMRPIMDYEGAKAAMAKAQG